MSLRKDVRAQGNFVTFRDTDICEKLVNPSRSCIVSETPPENITVKSGIQQRRMSAMKNMTYQQRKYISWTFFLYSTFSHSRGTRRRQKVLTNCILPQQPITISDHKHEYINKYSYMGSIDRLQCSTEVDIRTRLLNAWSAFANLQRPKGEFTRAVPSPSSYVAQNTSIRYSMISTDLPVPTTPA